MMNWLQGDTITFDEVGKRREHGDRYYMEVLH
jgi:hypothetical protein